MSKASSNIPIFKLYGEAEAWHTPDLIHIEEIAYRSRPNNWLIKPHRHADILQLLYIKHGSAEVLLDGEKRTLESPGLVLIPMMSIHSFQFSDDISGYILSLAAPLLRQLQGVLGTQYTLLDKPLCGPSLGTSASAIDALFTLLNEEYRRTAPGRQIVLESSAASLLVLISRAISEQIQSKNPQRQDKGSLTYAKFIALIEQHYQQQLGIEEYAAKLNISSARLNALCQRIMGKSALQLIHLRLLEEAKRNLIYTSMNVAEIADLLGFSEPAYFTRFFKRLTDQSPKDFRKISLLRGQQHPNKA